MLLLQSEYLPDRMSESICQIKFQLVGMTWREYSFSLQVKALVESRYCLTVPICPHLYLSIPDYWRSDFLPRLKIQTHRWFCWAPTSNSTGKHMKTQCPTTTLIRQVSCQGWNFLSACWRRVARKEHFQGPPCQLLHTRFLGQCNGMPGKGQCLCISF